MGTSGERLLSIEFDPFRRGKNIFGRNRKIANINLIPSKGIKLGLRLMPLRKMAQILSTHEAYKDVYQLCA